MVTDGGMAYCVAFWWSDGEGAERRMVSPVSVSLSICIPSVKVPIVLSSLCISDVPMSEALAYRGRAVMQAKAQKAADASGLP